MNKKGGCRQLALISTVQVETPTNWAVKDKMKVMRDQLVTLHIIKPKGSSSICAYAHVLIRLIPLPRRLRRQLTLNGSLGSMSSRQTLAALVGRGAIHSTEVPPSPLCALALLEALT